MAHNTHSLPRANSLRIPEENMFRNWKLVGPIVLILAAATACNRNRKSADSASAAPAAAVIADTSAGVAVAVPVDPGVELDVAAPPGAAIFLVDHNGRPVYTIEDASGGNAKLTGNCATNFTPVAGHSTAASGDTSIKSSMTGSTTGANGSKQATYNGKPLYYYNGDQARGDAKGNGMKEDCGTAHLVSPGGTSASSGKGKKK
jgi:predicted lipoprotein with Yx(FWY)xxD motif